MRKTTLAAICIAVLTLAGAVAALAAASRAQVAASYEMKAVTRSSRRTWK